MRLGLELELFPLTPAQIEGLRNGSQMEAGLP